MKKITLLFLLLTLCSGAISYAQTQPTVHNPTFDKIAKNSGSDCSCSGWINKSVADQGESSTTSGNDVVKLDNVESDGVYQEVEVIANSDYTLDLDYKFSSTDTTTEYLEILVLKGSGYVADYTPAYAVPAEAEQDGFGYTTVESVDLESNQLSRTTVVVPGDTEMNAISTINFNTGTETSIAIFIRAVGPYDSSAHGDSSKDKGWMNGDTEVRIDNFSLVNLGEPSASSTPVLTAIVDGDCSGGTPKLLEIYADGTVDFSLYSIENQSNANTSWGATQSLADLGTVTDDFVYITTSGSSDSMISEFPSVTSSQTLVSNTMNLNGDDRIRIILTSDSSVVDQYGETDVDGTGKSWEYKDSYAKRVEGTSADSGFVEANWVYAGAGSLDGLGVCQGGTDTYEVLIGGVGTYTTTTTTTPEISITAPTDGATLASTTTSVTVSVSTTDFAVGATDAGLDGHIHWSIQENSDAAVDQAMKYDTNDETISVTAGNSYTVFMELRDNSHQPLSPEVNTTITFTVAAPVAVALPLDFETATTWADFDGGVVTTVSNPDTSGNSSANVGKMVKNAGQPWGGSSLVLDAAMDFTTNDTFTMKVWSPRVGATVLLKVEDSNVAANFHEVSATTTVASTWETLTFDYSAINTANSYDKLVLIFDNGTMGDGSDNFTFYIDDIELSAAPVAVALPLDFETATTWADFDGGVVTTVSNPDTSGNSSANVGKMVKNAGQPWGGSSLVLDAAMDFTTNDTFTMKVWSPRVGATVLLKVEDSNVAANSHEVSATTTVASTWETLTFDYSAINTANSYDKLVLIFDNGTMGDGSDNFTFYIDDIELSAAPVAVALPLDFETATTWADFDGGVVTTVSNPDTSGNSSANVGKMVKNAGQPWGGSSLVLDAAMDFTTNDTFTMKVWSPRVGATVLLKVEDSNVAANFHEVSATTTVASTWETLTFDYSAINTANSYDKLVLIFDNGTMGDGSDNFTFYIDDIELSAAPVAVALPLDFETATTWADFDGGVVTTVSNPDTSGNSSANVGKMVKNAGQPWGGSSLVLDAAMDFTTNDTFTMKVWSPRVGATVLLKVEDSNVAANFHEVSATTTVASTWETLTFDYSAINTANSYDKLVLIFDNGTMGDGSDNFTFYIDDIELSAAPVAVALPLDFETATTWADFDGGVVTTVSNPDTSGNSSANVGKMVKNAGQPWGGSSLVLDAAMDFTTNDTFTMKVWSPRVGATVLLKVEDSNVAANFHEVSATTTVASTWETLTFDYSAINTANSYDKLVLIFDNGTMGDGSDNFTFYIDDIELIGETAGLEDDNLITLNMYPNPANDVLNISSQSTINMVEIFNVLGQKVITMQVEDTSAEINVSNLNAGIYLIKYEINNSTSTKKFVKN